MTAHEIATRLPEELRLLNPAQEVAHGTVWLRDMLERSGQTRYVLGLSGGLDSAVVALWAARAVGGESLTLLALPYQGGPDALLDASRPNSITHAELIADAIPGANFRIIDITRAVDTVLDELGYTEIQVSDPDLHMAAANAKALVRATVLRTETRRRRGLLLGTENRTEHLLGYFTVGGDEQSDLEVLLPFFKSQVRQLAAELGVPDVIIEKPPTADLWAGQRDEDELGFTYDQADFVLYYSDERMDAPEVARRIAEGSAAIPARQDPPAWAATVVGRVLGQRDRTRFKRRPKAQFPTANRTHA